MKVNVHRDYKSSRTHPHTMHHRTMIVCSTVRSLFTLIVFKNLRRLSHCHQMNVYEASKIKFNYRNLHSILCERGDVFRARSVFNGWKINTTQLVGKYEYNFGIANSNEKTVINSFSSLFE